MAKKTSKTNKTSHVLNLLTSGEGEQGNIENTSMETLADVPEAEGKKPSAPRKRRSVSSAIKREEQEESQVTVIDEARENDRLSREIQRNLEESMKQEMETCSENRESEDGGVNTNAERSADTTEASGGEPVKKDSIPERAEKKTPREEKLIEKSKAADEYVKDEIPEADTGEEEFHIVNVMAAILKQQSIPEFMAKYGCCTCNKCVADVNALALTRLPAKYVVLKKDATSPMIGYYQSRYRADILASLLRACLIVKESPRHDR